MKQLETIVQLPPPNEVEEDAAQWRRAKGWWLSDGSLVCHADKAVIPIGAAVYLTGQPGYIVCEKHTPHKRP